MDISSIMEIPSGLMRKSKQDPRMTIENVELRAVLDKAVADADLNVTERMSLNEKFFPNGGGFELFPKDTRVARFNIFYRPGQAEYMDSFTREVEAVKLPEDVCMRQDRIMRSKKGNFQANLDNALKKLGKVLKGNV